MFTCFLTLALYAYKKGKYFDHDGTYRGIKIGFWGLGDKGFHPCD